MSSPRSARLRSLFASLVVVLFGTNILLGTSAGATSPIASPSDEAAVRTRLQAADRELVARIRAELTNPRQRPHDVHARAALLDFDPERLFRFVQTRIRFEPYPGLQRGPNGVLVSGSGNSADQASLLVALLAASGYEAEIVRGRLGASQTQALLNSAVESISNRDSVAIGPFGKLPLDLERARAGLRELGIAAESLLAIHHDLATDRAAEWEAALALVERERKWLESEIRAAGLETEVRDVPAELVSMIANHYWVRYRPTPGSGGIDLDPTFPSLAPGETATPSEGSVDPLALADRFRITLELARLVGDKREDVVLVEHEVPVFTLLVEPLRLTIAPTKLGELAESAEALVQQLQTYRQFQARLTVGTEAIGSKVFDYDGTVSEVRSNGFIEAIGDAGAGVRRGLGGAFGGGGKQQGPKTELLGVWVEVGLVRAGDAIWKQRRTILEEADREHWCAMVDWRFFLQSHELSDDFVRFIQRSRRVTQDARRQLLLEWESSRDPALLLRLARTRDCTYPMEGLELGRSRQTRARIRRDDGSPRLLWFEHADIFLVDRRPVFSDSAPTLSLRTRLDILENGALILDAGRNFALDQRATMELGVFDTVIEQAIIASTSPAEVAGAVNVFENARLEGRARRFIPAHDVPALTEAGVSAPDITWLGQYRPPNEQVLVSASTSGPVRAWWSHDPSTGRTLGRISGGAGSANTEYLLTTSNAISDLLCLGALFTPKEKHFDDALRQGTVDDYAWLFVSCVGSGSVAEAAFKRIPILGHIISLWSMYSSAEALFGGE